MVIIEMKVERDYSSTSPLGMVQHDHTKEIDIEVEVINVGSVRKPEFEVKDAFEVETGNDIKLEQYEAMEAIDKAYNEYLNNLPDRC